MAKEKLSGQVSISITAEDEQQIAVVCDTAPFSKDVLLRLALRIGLKTIQEDPASLMPYLVKKTHPK